MSDPAIQKKILAKAKSLASDLSDDKVADYKEEEKKKLSNRVHKYFDKMENVFASAVKVYAEKHDLKDSESVQLQGLIENGFDKQRKLFDQAQSGELTREEAKKQGGISRKEDKVAIVAFLGEEGATDFMAIFMEEAKKAREAKEKEEGEESQ